MINENENVEISLAESIKIFRGSDEGFNHVGLHKVAIELIQLRQPEVVAGMIGVLRIIRITAQVSKELH